MSSQEDFEERRPVEPPGLWVPVSGGAIEANGTIYAGNRCPHCSIRLTKLPRRDSRCRSCGGAIVRIKGDDNLVYLLRDEDAGPLRIEMAAHWSLTHVSQPGWRWDPEAIRRLRRAWLVRYAALGLGVRVVLWTNAHDPCEPCRSLCDIVFDPANAPELPLWECRNFYCTCSYEPVILNGRT
jgi:hypothetical protein